MTQSKLLTQANHCHNLDDCYSFLTTLAQNYCKNNISANDLTDLASLVLTNIPKKALRKSQIKVFNQILGKQHVYTLSKAKKVLFNYTQRALKAKDFSGAICACQILQNFKNDSVLFDPNYEPYFILKIINEDNPMKESEVYSFRVKFENVLKIVIELKYALKEQTTNLTKIKDNTKSYYLKFENIFNYYKDNHSEPKTIANKLKNQRE